MTDPYEFDDGAYVLNSLPPHERAAFEEHMSGCAACTARVREIQDVPWLLVDITTEDVAAATEPLPDTMLPGLLRRGMLALLGRLAAVVQGLCSERPRNDVDEGRGARSPLRPPS